jgi:hypothetical protein
MNRVPVDSTVVQRTSVIGRPLPKADFSDLEFVDLSGPEFAWLPSVLEARNDNALWRHGIAADPTNADLGFGPGSDDEQDEFQWFLSTGRIIA